MGSITQLTFFKVWVLVDEVPETRYNGVMTNKGTNMTATKQTPREQSAAAMKEFVQALLQAQTDKGYSSADSAWYTVGYLESFIVEVMTDLSEVKRKAVIKEIAVRIQSRKDGK